MDNRHLIEAAVAAALRGADGQLQTTNLMKALFYFDLLALRETGKTYTGVTYHAYERGPVVEDYKAVLGRLAARGVARQVDTGMAKPVILNGDHPAWIEDGLLDTCAKIGKWASDQTARKISDLAHLNPGWVAARRRGDKEPINMVLAMQQLMDIDPWLDEELTEAERSELAAVSGDECVPL